MWHRQGRCGEEVHEDSRTSSIPFSMKVDFPAVLDGNVGDNLIADLGLDDAMRFSAPHAGPNVTLPTDTEQNNGTLKVAKSAKQSIIKSGMEGATRCRTVNTDLNPGESPMRSIDYDLEKIISMSDLGNEGSTQRSNEMSKMAASLSSLAALGNDAFQNARPPLAEGVLRVDMKSKHKCHECGKEFKRAHNLKIHGRLHSGDKPYGCPFAHCTKEFRWKSSIVSHLNWHRTKKGELLPGFDGTASGYDTKKQKEKFVLHGKQDSAHDQPGNKLAGMSPAKKLERALVLETQAQARHSAALREVEEAVAAASHAKVAVEIAASVAVQERKGTSNESSSAARIGATDQSLNVLLKGWVQEQERTTGAGFTLSSSSENDGKEIIETAQSGSCQSPETIGSSSKDVCMLPPQLSVGVPLPESLALDPQKSTKPRQAAVHPDPSIHMSAEPSSVLGKSDVEDFQDHGLFDLFSCQ